jgi:signal peptidase II
VRGLQERRAVLTPLTRRGVAPALVAAAVVAADQVSKSWALHALKPYGTVHHVFGPLALELTLNPGAAFSLGTGITPVIEVVAAVLVVALAAYSRRARHGGWLLSVGTGLLLGGAVSNLGDRLFRHHHGAVVDFVSIARVGGHDYWPIFNVADAAITVGVVMVVIALSRSPARPPVKRR